MAKRPPKTVTLDPDDYTARYVGWTTDGRQFFLTEPFVPALDGPGREFLALYLFDKDGVLLEALIEDLGARAELDEDAARLPAGNKRRHLGTRGEWEHAKRCELLASLGEVAYRRIRVAPFRVERFGVEFGFIPRPPEEPDEDWCVTVEPGDYMCFWPPWTTGDYDT